MGKGGTKQYPTTDENPTELELMLQKDMVGPLQTSLQGVGNIYDQITALQKTGGGLSSLLQKGIDMSEALTSGGLPSYARDNIDFITGDILKRGIGQANVLNSARGTGRSTMYGADVRKVLDSASDATQRNMLQWRSDLASSAYAPFEGLQKGMTGLYGMANTGLQYPVGVLTSLYGSRHNPGQKDTVVKSGPFGK